MRTARAKSGRASASESLAVSLAMSDSARRQLIAEIAYLHAERRNFAPGGELDDWLAAEAEVERRLAGHKGAR